MDTTTDAGGRAALVRGLAWGGALVLLLLPAAAMQFDLGFDWTTYDFVFWGALIAGAGLLVELALKALRTPLYRLVAVGAVLALAVLIWADAAVGVF